MPRIVPLVSNRRVCEVSNNADVSQRKVIQIVREVLGDDLLEPRGKYFIFAQPKLRHYDETFNISRMPHFLL